MRTTNSPHIGQNVKALLALLNIKQETLASELDVSQQQVSKILQKEEIDKALLQQIADVMNIPVEAIENYSSEAFVQFIGNTYHINTHDNSNQAQYQYQPSFNYADKLVEYLERTIKEKDTQIDKLKAELEALKKKH
ncbi:MULTISPECIES: helix-turn-helix domain-containing protein [Chitinophaga]|nr:MULTISPECIES: helix-turn-helix transcriptional regulator [Chitinophaga]